jgi:D-alanine-D-alanine ligase
MIVGHLDVPVNPQFGMEHFHRDPEWLYGEGVGSSRASLAMLEMALRALRHVRRLNRTRLGVAIYADEGRDCEESADVLRRACAEASRVLVLNPGNANDRIITSRRGQRRYRLRVEGKALRLGQSGRNAEVMRVLYRKLDELTGLTDRKTRVAVSVSDIATDAFPMRLPHRVRIGLTLSYPDQAQADNLERAMRDILRGGGVQWNLVLVSDRPPMPERKINQPLVQRLQAIAAEWDILLETDSSLWPSAAGLVPDGVPVVCGLGPVTNGLYTSDEAVSRISLVQRTLVLMQCLLDG